MATTTQPTTESAVENQTTSIRTSPGESDEQNQDKWTDYRITGRTAIETENLDVFYSNEQALTDISLDIPAESVTALVGPSGCGKSTFFRCLNRMNDRIRAARIDGVAEIDGQDIYRDGVDLVELRKRIGIVFQQPNPFPKSIRDNIAYGPRKHGDIETGLLARLFGDDSNEQEHELVERSLRQAALWGKTHNFSHGSPDSRINGRRRRD
jgi:phosphate transport system ATP-binding protein